MLRILFSISLIVSSSTILRAADEKPNILKLDSGATLAAPDGYTWKKIGEQTRAGKKHVMYLATSEKAGAKLFVGVEPEVADTDAKRTARIKGFFDGIVKPLSASGRAKDIKLALPSTDPPIPDRVQGTVTATVNDEPMVIVGVLVFGKNTYHIQAGASTEQEATALVKSTESLKE